MKKTLKIFFAVLALFSAATSHAIDLGVSAEAGTTGIGAHISLPVTPLWNLRFGLNTFDYSYYGSTSDVNYKFKLKLNTLDLLADWFPFHNGFRMSAGVIYNGNKITAVGQPNARGTYTVNGNTYSTTTAGQLNGNADFRSMAPYAGIGWGNAVAKDQGWGFTADFGAMFQGSGSTTLTNTGCTAPTPCAQLATDVAAENLKLNNQISKYKIYPVVRLGVSYRF